MFGTGQTTVCSDIKFVTDTQNGNFIEGQDVFMKDYAPSGNIIRPEKLFLAWRSESMSQGHWLLCHLRVHH